MNKRFIKILIFGLLYSGVAHTQEKNPVETIKEEQSAPDTASVDTARTLPTIYDHALYIGLDAFTPVRGLFNRKNTGYQAVVALRIYKKFHLAFEAGRSSITYDRLDWKANIQGVYYKAGFNWSLYEHPTDPDQMYYVGLRYAFSPYRQEVRAYPVRSRGAAHTGGSLPEVRLKGQWIEPVIGARVAIFDTPIYVDASLNLKFLIASSGQQGMDPLAIPGFGENRDNKNLGIKWAIVYKIPIIKGKK